MHPAFALVAVAMLVGAVGYVRLQAYGSGRAIEMGMKPHVARDGGSDDSGATQFDRGISTEVLTGRYKTVDPRLLKLARSARLLNAISLAILAAAVAWLALLPE